MAQRRERTFLMIKHDAVQRGLVGTIIERFEKKGFKLVALKFVWPSELILQQHYRESSAEPFFSYMMKFMNSGPIVPMVWEGFNVIKTGRQLIGHANPAISLPGTIRGDLYTQLGTKLIHGAVIHGSDTVEAANREIALWFNEEELIDWTSVAESWVYE